MTRVCRLTSLCLLSMLTFSGCIDGAIGDPISVGPTRRAPRAPSPAPRATRLGLAITPLPSAAGGGKVALDVTGARGRGLDPVLRVGDRVLRDSAYVRPGVLRFVTDASAVPPGAPVTLSYGATP